MFRILHTLKSVSFQSLHITQSSFFGTGIYVKNKGSGLVKKVHQKQISLDKEKAKLLAKPEEAIRNISTASSGQQSQTRIAFNDQKSKTIKPVLKQKKVEEEKKDDETSGDTTSAAETAIESIENRRLMKEKQFSSQILSLGTKDEVLNLYHRSFQQIRPIHMALTFAQVIKLSKLEAKLARFKETSANRSPRQIVSLWEDDRFVQLYHNVLENVENMNPDSLIKVLYAISIRKTEREEQRILYNKVTEWLVKDSNVLLFDRLQTIKLLVYFAKLASKSHFEHDNNNRLFRLISGKIRGEIKELRTSNIIKIYQTCVRLKYQDAKLFALLNIQVKKRLNFIQGKDLITCCAANIACKSTEAEIFVPAMLNFVMAKDLQQTLGHKDLLNLMILVNEVLQLPLEESFREKCKLLIHHSVGRMLNMQMKFLRRQTTVVNTNLSEAEEEKKFLKIDVLAHFFRNVMFLKYTDRKVVTLVKNVLTNEIPLSMDACLFMMTYLLNYKTRINDVEGLEIEEMVTTMIPKLEEKLTRLSAENLQLLQYILSSIFEDPKLLELANQNSKVFTALQLTLRKILHNYIKSNYKLAGSNLLKQLTFLDKHREVTLGGKVFQTLEFYLRSIGKNLLEPLFITAMQEGQGQDLDAVQLKLSEKDRANILNSLWIISMLLSKEYPIVGNAAILLEYAQVIKQHFVWKELTIEQIDRLIEIKSLFENSYARDLFKSVFSSQEVQDIIEKRFKTIQENALNRRKGIRNQLEAATVSVLGAEGAKITQGVLLPEEVVADLLVEKDKEEYAIIFYTDLADKKLQKLDQMLKESEDSRQLHSPMTQRVLESQGYKALFINIPTWTRRNEEQKKELLRAFFRK